jgi:hypothetical protein
MSLLCTLNFAYSTLLMSYVPVLAAIHPLPRHNFAYLWHKTAHFVRLFANRILSFLPLLSLICHRRPPPSAAVSRNNRSVPPFFPYADISSLNNGKITLRGQLSPTNWPKITSRGQILPTNCPRRVSSRTQILNRLLLFTRHCNIQVSFQQSPTPQQYLPVFTAPFCFPLRLCVEFFLVFN